MQQANGDDFGLESPQTRGQLSEAFLIDRFQNLSISIESLSQTENERRLDDRASFLNKKIVEFRSSLTADVDYVLETRGRNQCDASAFAFEDGIRCDGRAMHDFGS